MVFEARKEGTHRAWVTASVGDEKVMWGPRVDVLPPGTATAEQGGPKISTSDATVANPYLGTYTGTLPLDAGVASGDRLEGHADAPWNLRVSVEGWVRGGFDYLWSAGLTTHCS